MLINLLSYPELEELLVTFSPSHILPLYSTNSGFPPVFTPQFLFGAWLFCVFPLLCSHPPPAWGIQDYIRGRYFNGAWLSAQLNQLHNCCRKPSVNCDMSVIGYYLNQTLTRITFFKLPLYKMLICWLLKWREYYSRHRWKQLACFV